MSFKACVVDNELNSSGVLVTLDLVDFDLDEIKISCCSIA